VNTNPVRTLNMQSQHDDAARVSAYHERSKHAFGRYAASLGYLDWATQPDPFRRFDGASLTPLPFSADLIATPYEALYAADAAAPRPVDAESLGALFELSLGLSAWKSAGGTRWALRNNPSSGNLHPTEGYLVCAELPGIQAGVHHYAPAIHALEHRCAFQPSIRDAVVIGLTSIHWREAWKYGERAYRYCQHDVGHAIAAVRFAAAALGWKAALLPSASDSEIAGLLGLDRPQDFVEAEDESPDALLLVSPRPTTTPDTEPLARLASTGAWTGVANRLSVTHHPWPVIEETAQAAVKPATHEVSPSTRPRVDLPAAYGERAIDIVRKRRSAQAFDPRRTLKADSFFSIVDRLATRDAAPFDALPWDPLVHPVIAVHRVDDLAPGLYSVMRSNQTLNRLKSACSASFDWSVEYDAPGVTLYHLQDGDYREAMRLVSCTQDIASHGFFTLGMVAEFDPVIREGGPWWYRRLFWEAGVIGQALYLEAEAQGVRGTGIGCYLDDAFHRLLGLETTEFQSMYHFTVGYPIEDERLLTEPPYAHLERERGGHR
jgi:SagB-type dehydrogenase family enzyme